MSTVTLFVCWYRGNTKGATSRGGSRILKKLVGGVSWYWNGFRQADIKLGRTGRGVSENTILEHGCSSKWHSNLDKIFGPTIKIHF